jgi:hypothetical protein|tara:strand:+ start:1576 stop:1788 length:213 start_codon:yes stop_codon:yes gene_type:complete
MNKFFLKSKTLWGVIVTLLPVLLPILGVTFAEGSESLITETGDAFVQLLGAALAVYGRFDAGGLTVSVEQ